MRGLGCRVELLQPRIPKQYVQGSSASRGGFRVLYLKALGLRVGKYAVESSCDEY